MKNTENHREVDDAAPVRSSAKSSRRVLFLTVATVLSLAAARSPSRSFVIVASERGLNSEASLDARVRRKATYPKAPKSLGPKPCAAKQHYHR